MGLAKHFVLLTLLVLLSFHAEANIKIDGLSLSEVRPGTSQMTIRLAGELLENPELLVNDRMIQLSVPKSYVWPKIEKKATLGTTHDTTIMAYQFEKDIVRVRAMLPYSLAGKENLVSVVMRDGLIELNFPQLAEKTKQPVAVTPVPVKESFNEPSAIQKELNQPAPISTEAILQQLVAESDFEEKKEKPRDVLKDSNIEDAVTATKSAPERDNSGFSLTTYVGKFVAFLALVLMLFYGIVHLMKKGVLKKGKLGFLNNTKVVEVLNTTYIAPKKSLIMVKAHNQVFLIGSCEKGLNLISEVTDLTGLLKNGEKEVSGDNFDTTLSTVDASTATRKFRLKPEPVNVDKTDTVASGLQDLLEEKPVKDSVKLSDQIKSKVKNLKSLQ